MSGRVLIVDDTATNRIILKVKLASAYYEVAQAASVEEACACTGSFAPDLILVGGGPARTDARATLERLRRTAGDSPLSIAVILDDDAPAGRVAALRAGADEVFSRPVQDRYFLARLRSLLRQRHADREILAQAETAGGTGFAEHQQAFDMPGHIVIVAADRIAGRKLQASLERSTRHSLRNLAGEQIMSGEGHLAPSGRQPAPDLVLLTVNPATPDEALHLLANLGAAPAIRDCPVIVQLPEDMPALAATLLDMGAADIIFSGADLSELSMRLSARLAHKRHTERLRRHLRDSLEASVTDPLTGLYNRRYALAYLARLLSGEARTGQTHAVMLADLDHFKQVNDTYGHLAGDKVLAHVAATLRHQMRPGDLIARIGGEEFLIVQPNTTRSMARNAAHELCRTVRRTPASVRGVGPQVPVTISIGLTLTESRAGIRPEDVIDLADRALYCSKADGRNTVTFSTRTAA